MAGHLWYKTVSKSIAVLQGKKKISKQVRGGGCGEMHMC